jgi:hypothetical protein
MSAVKHLVAVWNPAYGNDVMEAHIRIIRDRGQRSKRAWRLG